MSSEVVQSIVSINYPVKASLFEDAEELIILDIPRISLLLDSTICSNISYLLDISRI